MNHVTTVFKKLALRGRFRTGYVVYYCFRGDDWSFWDFCFDLDSALHAAEHLNSKGIRENDIIVSK